MSYGSWTREHSSFQEQASPASPQENVIRPSANAIGAAIVAAFDEDARTIAALRAALEEVTKARNTWYAKLTQLEQHHDATRKALGLTGWESRPYAAYIYDLRQQLADAHAKIRLLENKP